MVRCRKQHKGKEKVVRAREKRTHHTRTAWHTARTARAFPPGPSAVQGRTPRPATPRLCEALSQPNPTQPF